MLAVRRFTNKNNPVSFRSPRSIPSPFLWSLARCVEFVSTPTFSAVDLPVERPYQSSAMMFAIYSSRPATGTLLTLAAYVFFSLSAQAPNTVWESGWEWVCTLEKTSPPLFGAHTYRPSGPYNSKGQNLCEVAT